MKRPVPWIIALLAVMTLVWAQDQAASGASAEVVSAADTSVVLGTATFAEGEEGLTMTLDIGANDVITGGQHAIHIHQNGSCEAGDSDDDGEEEPAGAAGGHFNPTDVGHGVDNGPHVGDSTDYNYVFNDDGSFSGEVQFELASLSGDNSILTEDGTAIMIHEGTDDTKTDPGGGAGARVACGVISGTGQ